MQSDKQKAALVMHHIIEARFSQGNNDDEAHLILAACQGLSLGALLQDPTELAVSHIRTHPLPAREYCWVGARVGLVQHNQLHMDKGLKRRYSLLSCF